MTAAFERPKRIYRGDGVSELPYLVCGHVATAAR